MRLSITLWEDSPKALSEIQKGMPALIGRATRRQPAIRAGDAANLHVEPHRRLNQEFLHPLKRFLAGERHIKPTGNFGILQSGAGVARSAAMSSCPSDLANLA